MMTTPIADFIRQYAQSGATRLHMPGHKGLSPDPDLQAAYLHDLTEIEGADSLYHACGIIAESEANASALFGAHTFYSTEGSSLAIRTMLALALRHEKRTSPPVLLAGRNAHRVLLSAAALLRFEVRWLLGEDYLSCRVTADDLERALSSMEEPPFAVYLTSPDYLGNLTDIRACAEVCHRHGVLLLVDNAHGAYLKFLPVSRHPLDEGADMCADSAHKTLPVLTGGAYLHLHPRLSDAYRLSAKETMLLFGSTSPSYLILESLDACNPHLADKLPAALDTAIPHLEACRRKVAERIPVGGDEPLKWALYPKAYGYYGKELATHLCSHGIVCEFCDPDAVVLMFSPTCPEAADAVLSALEALPRRAPIRETPPAPTPTEQVLPIRVALLSPAECLPAERAVGRVLADAGVACPPAVPVLISGERITEEALRILRYYGIEACRVVTEKQESCKS